MPTVTFTVTLTGPDAEESADRLVQAISDVEHEIEQQRLPGPVIIDTHEFSGERTVDVHVRRIRVKLGEFGDAITTVHGFGYRFEQAQSFSVLRHLPN